MIHIKLERIDMATEDLFPSKHFDLEQLEDGVYVAIHKPSGAAYSNAGIIDLGDQTIVIDANHPGIPQRWPGFTKGFPEA
jgi:FKBP-type peptidyl-prolyl cis-trans isomerase 2